MSGATSSGDGDANGQPVKAPPSVRPLLVKPMAPCDNQPVLKEVGLRVLRTLVTHVRPTLKPVQRVGALLAQIGENGCALFKDWSPPSAAPDAPVPLIQGSALASSRLNLSSYAASKALDSGSFWASTANEDAAWWMASIMGDAAPLQSITLEGVSDRLSETVEVEVTAGGDAKSWVSLGYILGAKLATQFSIPLDGVMCKRIRLTFRGFHKDNKSLTHTLKSIALTRAKPAVLHTKSSEVLAGVESWLLRAASDTADPVCREAAFGALMKLALATGAVTAVTRVVQVALQAGDASLSPEFADAGHKFLQSIRDQFFDVCSTNAGGSTTGGTNVMTDVVFDQSSGFHSSSITFEDGGKLARCTGGNEYAIVNVPFSSGKGAWEFKLETDTPNGECSCMGFVTMPVTSSNYEHSSSMFMYRCYNGNLYQQGRNLYTPLSKVHPGDTVRFELDMDAGVCTIDYNGTGPRPAFKDLQGKTVFPAVAFYSSNRSIRVLSVEVEGRGVASGDVMVSRLPAVVEAAKTAPLELGPKFRNTTDTMTVDGEPLRTAVAFKVKPVQHGGAEDGRSVSVPLSGLNVDTFRSTVALVRSPASADEAQFEGSATFAVLNDDDEVLWEETLTDPTAVAKVELCVEGVRELTLRVTGNCTESPGLWRAVWAQPRLCCAPWWWEYKKLEAEDSPIVAATKTPPTSFMDLGTRMLLVLQLYANEALRAMRNSKPPVAGSEPPPLELPFTLQVCPATFSIVLDLLKTLTPRAAAGEKRALSVATSVLRMLTANIRRLVVSGIRPADVGLDLATTPSEEDGESKGTEGAEAESKTESTLAPLQALLENLAGLPGRSVDGVTLELSLEAGEVLDAGLQLFFPSVAQRRARMTNLMANGGVVEVNFTWPCKGDDGEPDARFERAVLLLHSLCRRKKWKCATAGNWSGTRGTLHVVVDVPAGKTETVVQSWLEEVMTTAGFQWHFPEGCDSPEIQLKVERSAEFDRTLRLKTEAGIGWVRLYPSDVATFDRVCAIVDEHVEAVSQAEAAAAVASAKASAKAAAKAAAKAGKDTAKESGSEDAAASPSSPVAVPLPPRSPVSLASVGSDLGAGLFD